jgi:hypothetical protein
MRNERTVRRAAGNWSGCVEDMKRRIITLAITLLATAPTVPAQSGLLPIFLKGRLRGIELVKLVMEITGRRQEAQ